MIDIKKPMVRIQGYGYVPAIPASELKPGMIAVWNYGHEEEILSVEYSKTGKSLYVKIKPLPEGKVLERKLRTSTLVAIKQAI